MVFPLRIVSVALPATAFTDAALAATQGFRTMTPFAVVNLVFEPAFRVALTARVPRRRLGPERRDGRAAHHQPRGRRHRRGVAAADDGHPHRAAALSVARAVRLLVGELAGVAGGHRPGVGRHDHRRHLPSRSRGGRLPGRHPADGAGHHRPASDRHVVRAADRRPVPPRQPRAIGPALRRRHELDVAVVAPGLHRARAVSPAVAAHLRARATRARRRSPSCSPLVRCSTWRPGPPATCW